MSEVTAIKTDAWKTNGSWPKLNPTKMTDVWNRNIVYEVCAQF